MSALARSSRPPSPAGPCADALDAQLQAANQKIDELTASRNEAHATIAKLLADIAFKNHEIESWAYCVGHDLRAPLRAVEGFSRMFEETLGTHLDGEAGEYQRRVQRAASRLEQRIAGLLELFKAGRGDIVREDVDLSAMARAVADEIAAAEGTTSGAVVIEPHLRVSADRRLLRLVLSHLVGNAWKFTSRVPARKIEIGATTDFHCASWYVRDNGAGFDPAYAERLFAPFQRLHGEGEFPGLGIGLATVNRVARRHGGRVHAHGNVGEGAEIVLTLSARSSVVPPR